MAGSRQTNHTCGLITVIHLEGRGSRRGPGFRADQRPVNVVPDYRKVLNFLELDLGGRIRHGGTLGSVWVCTED
jgi:hypothetical protein